jgi:CRP-like cAMP-binding protein
MEVMVTEKNLLSEFKFFGDVTPESLEMISKKAEVLEMEAGDVVFHFNEPALHLYGLLKGEIDLSLVFTDKVLKTDIEYEEVIQTSMVDEEKCIVVDTVYPGQVFGWASLVGPGRRTVTAQCTEASRVLCMQASDLKTLFEKDHSLGYTLMAKLCDIISNRLKNRTNKLIETWVEAFDVNKI